MPSTPSDLGCREAEFASFKAKVWSFHKLNRRDLAWRRTCDPYEILVSEIMLQQTQVARVAEKYPSFLAAFPSIAVLAGAEVGEVLAAWQGLGYNRRALALHRAAKLIRDEHGGHVPNTVEALRRLPGVGQATAAALSAFAFGRAEPFIETNIRAAYIHHFFTGDEGVDDADILPLVAATMDQDEPREWFYALMDYGVWIKRAFGNPSRRSRHYAVQSPFAGSRREFRARVLRALLAMAPAETDLDTLSALLSAHHPDPEILTSVLEDMAREGFLEKDGATYRITG